jgi:hypothetical protein
MDVSVFAPNFQHVRAVLEELLGEGKFAALYPELSGVGDSGTSIEDPSQTNAAALFAAITAKIAVRRDEFDIYLLNAIRLDLHSLKVAPGNQYRGDNGANDARLCSIVAGTFGKDFVNANYLAHLSNNYRYLYVSVPKTGCTKIKKTLQDAESGRALDHSHRVHAPIFSPLLEPIDDVVTLRAAMTSDAWFRFGFVRNPFSRILSCYLDKIVRSAGERQRLLPVLGLDAAAATPSFSEFVRLVSQQDDGARDIHWASQYYLLRPDLVDYTFIGRFERLSADLKHVCDTLSISPLEPMEKKEHSVGDVPRMCDYYTATEQRMVAEAYRHDFEAFEYDPNALPNM